MIYMSSLVGVSNFLTLTFKQFQEHVFNGTNNFPILFFQTPHRKKKKNYNQEMNTKAVLASHLQLVDFANYRTNTIFLI